MSEENQNAENQDSGNEEGKNGAAQANTDLDSKLSSLQLAHDKANKKARTLAEENARLKSELEERTKKETENSGDVNKIREMFQADVTKLQTQNTELQARLKKTVVESTFNQLAGSYFTEAAIKTGDVWKLLSDQVDVAEDDDGNYIPVAKNSALPFESFLQKFAEERPFLAKNPGKAGVGTKGTEKSGAGATEVPSDFQGWSFEKKKEWMRDNPKLAARAAAIGFAR